MSKGGDQAAGGALAGLRVIEFGSLIAGPFAGQLLADQGADVIKVEPPGHGDPLRQWGSGKVDGEGLWWAVIGRNKKSVTIDLRRAEGQALARRLVVGADIVIENFRPGTMERWNLGYEHLSQDNVGLIMARMSGFGQTGPYSRRAGFGSVGEAMGGIRYVTGDPEKPPARCGVSIGDSLTAMFGTIGILSALEARRRTGRGQVIDAALYESVLAVMENLVPEYDRLGLVRERSGSILPGVAPSNAYTCADGLSIVIGANADGVFSRLATAMGQPELAMPDAFGTHAGRAARQLELDRIIEDWTSSHSSEQIIVLMEENGVPAGLIYRAPEMIADPHFIARKAIVEVAHDRIGSVKMQNVFPRLLDTPGSIRWPGAALGQHNDIVFGTELGLSRAELEVLKRDGVI